MMNMVVTFLNDAHILKFVSEIPGLSQSGEEEVKKLVILWP